ncbi:MAG: UDP-glucose 4-epimerase GalE [Planctomycetota bacterium]
MRILVTGGAGYVGSHAAQLLLGRGHDVLVVDNLGRGHAAAIERLRGSLSDEAAGRLTFERAEIGDRTVMQAMLTDHRIEAVVHFAALAYVGESVTDPLVYHANNTGAAVELLRACDGAGVTRFVFSSTCATYGEPDAVPIAETEKQSPINPYGWSKLHVERALFDYAEACRKNDKPFGFAALRYFNVAGSDRTGVLGEWHQPETHLIPIIIQAALGQREHVTIFGTDYDTPDGTCIRDYIHVEDLCDAHDAVLQALRPGDARTYNLGIGNGYSVREMIEATRRVAGREIRVVEGERRAGDPPRLFANPEKIAGDLGWRAKITDLDEIIGSAWRWFEANPTGYDA